MNYLMRLAEEIRREVPQDLLPDHDTTPLMLMYAVLARAKGTTVSAEDVHDAWCAWMATTDADHTSIVPFEDLEPDVQALDEPFADAIRRVAARWDTEVAVRR